LLPFLKNKKQIAGLIIEQRKPDIKPEEEQEEDYGIETCARDLLSAIESKDVKGIAEAMKSAFEVLESTPHEENDESYESQNRKAGEEEQE